MCLRVPRFVHFPNNLTMCIHSISMVSSITISVYIDCTTVTPPPFWKKSPTNNFRSLLLQSRYITSMYFIFTTLTSVGFGNVAPNSSLEKLTSILVMLLGCKSKLTKAWQHGVARHALSCFVMLWHGVARRHALSQLKFPLEAASRTFEPKSGSSSILSRRWKERLEMLFYHLRQTISTFFHFLCKSWCSTFWFHDILFFLCFVANKCQIFWWRHSKNSFLWTCLCKFQT